MFPESESKNSSSSRVPCANFCRSGELNAKQRELAELQALAQRRLKSTRANLQDGVKAAKEVRKDLEWTQKRVRYVPSISQSPSTFELPEPQVLQILHFAISSLILETRQKSKE